ncbi:hypothetical protein [Rhizorhapis sp. SPR117]|uniref:hypothetical protein n=1 Tax=Rhizorhapis sp. SPR117 TaxID=2912611 RepID=UPI001F3D7248|nr:hypothetical protein [Rhizorhapis sp. SPR117]
MTDNILKDSDSGRISTADIAGRTHLDEETVRDEPNQFSVSEEHPPLFLEDDADMLRTRWAQVQTSFVDEPRQAVADADSLVASAMTRLSEIFSDERSQLETQWDSGEDVSTEDLRIAMQRYRSFFERLLAV